LLILSNREGSAISATNSKPSDIDKQFVLLPKIFDENLSHFIDQNVAEFAPSANKNDPVSYYF
jgi:hypothetical protein